MGNVNVYYSVIGQNIRFYRHELNLTQDQLAEKAGISKQFVCNIERGRAIPSIETLLSLCYALDVESTDLLRCASALNPEAPCTLREEHNIFTDTLTDRLFPQTHEDTYIKLEDLPTFDIILPDENEEKGL